MSGTENDSLDVAATGDDPYVIALAPDPSSDDIWAVYQTYGSTVYICGMRWQGVATGSWDGGKVFRAGSYAGAPYENFSIAYGTYPAPPPSAPPDTPSNLAQYLSDWTPLSWETWTKYQVIRASFTLSDPESGEQLKYNIQFSTHSDFSYCYINSTQPAGADYLSEGATNFITTVEVALLPEGTWYWRVMATDDEGLSSSYASSNTANGYHFRIDVTAPTGLNNVSPADNSTDLSISTTLVCSSASDGLSGGIEYYFEISTTSSFNGLDDKNSGWQADTSYSPSLSYETTYYWHVKAKDLAGNETSFTTAWKFITQQAPPFTPPDMMLVYSSGTLNYPWFREIAQNTTYWGSEQSGIPAMNSEIQHLRLKENPVGDERILMTGINAGTGDYEIWVTTWIDGNWANSALQLADALPTGNPGMDDCRGFDVAFEDQSGEGLICYTKNVDDTIYYRIWNGSTFSVEYSTAGLPTGNTLTPYWIKMARRPGYDDIALIYLA